MNRRMFNQLLALGAGSVGLLPACAAQDENGPSTAPPGARNGKPEPVNVADFMALARAKLPKATYEYITTGSCDEVTLNDNVQAFRRMRLLPPLLKGIPKADLSTTVFKERISLPVILAPVAAQPLFHPQGPAAAARAAAAAGTVFGVSVSAGGSVEEIANAARGPKWFQLYTPTDRRVTRRLIERVERAGYNAIVVTVDLGEWKDADHRNRFRLPKDQLVKFLRDVGHEQVTDAMSYAELDRFNEQAWDRSLSWEIFDFLRSITKLPLLVKGVLRADDARKAVSIGLDGIVVSNHGGRALDTVPASIDRLAAVVEAVGGRAEVYMDSGVRRGGDVLKALALGARAVLIGRPYAWALAADGEAGVRKVLEMFRKELHRTMRAVGCRKTADIDPSLVTTGK